MFIPGIVASRKYATVYAADGVDFDGTNDNLTKTTDLTGAADNKTLTFSAWLRSDDSSNYKMILRRGSTTAQANAVLYLQKYNDGSIVLDVKNTAGTWILSAQTQASLLSSSTGWTHVMMSFDMGDAGSPLTKRHIYVNNTAATVTYATWTDSTFDHTTARTTIGWWESTGRRWDGRMAEFYFTNEYIDLSNSTNRAKFISGTGNGAVPVDLGTDGSTPTGTAPLIYFKGAAATWNAGTNSGSGGDFTMTGSVTDAAEEPIEAGT